MAVSSDNVNNNDIIETGVQILILEETQEKAVRHDIKIQDLVDYLTLHDIHVDIQAYSPGIMHEFDIFCVLRKKEVDMYEVLTEIVKKKPFYASLKRGDVIWISDFTYRNAGRCFWDGANVISQYNTIDEYGSVPPVFTCPEFPPTYWGEVEHHNFYVWLKGGDYVGEMLLNIKIGTLPHMGINTEVVYTTFTTVENGKKKTNYVLGTAEEWMDTDHDEWVDLMKERVASFDDHPVQVVSHWREFELLSHNDRESYDFYWNDEDIPSEMYRYIYVLPFEKPEEEEINLDDEDEDHYQ